MRELEGTMCLNCGCGEPETRHQPTDITGDDVQKAAEGGGLSLELAAANIKTSLDALVADAAAQGSSTDYAKTR